MQVDLTKARLYYENKDPTITTMLGGIPQVHLPDIKNSKSFLKRFWTQVINNENKNNLNSNLNKSNVLKYCLDVGAGIGRITKHVLIQEFPNAVVDFLEPNESFCLEAKKTIPSKNLRYLFNTTGQNFLINLQPNQQDSLRGGILIKNFNDQIKLTNQQNNLNNIQFNDLNNLQLNNHAEMNDNSTQQLSNISNQSSFLINQPWDLVWIQWVLLYFDDETFERLFKEFRRIGCRAIVLKCNATTSDKAIIDDEDGSIIRNEKQIRKCIENSGWKVLQHNVEIFNGFENLYPIHVFGCVPEPIQE